MFLPFLEENYFCGPLSRTECLIVRGEEGDVVGISGDRGAEAGQNSESSPCSLLLSSVLSAGLSSGAGKYWEFIQALWSPAWSRVCCQSCVTPRVTLAFPTLLSLAPTAPCPPFSLASLWAGITSCSWEKAQIPPGTAQPAGQGLCPSQQSSSQSLAAPKAGVTQGNSASQTHARCAKPLTSHTHSSPCVSQCCSGFWWWSFKTSLQGAGPRKTGACMSE